MIMEVNRLKLENGSLPFEGSEAISMTDYDIEPPPTLFGTIKATPEITIYFKAKFYCKQNKISTPSCRTASG